MNDSVGGNPCSTSLRSPEPQGVSALPGNDQGRKWTPGPWLIHAQFRWIVPAEDAFKEYADALPICQLRDPDERLTEDETLANGFLIAAATELEAVVAKFVEHCTFDTLGKGDNLDNLFAEAKAALAKAKGVSNGN